MPLARDRKPPSANAPCWPAAWARRLGALTATLPKPLLPCGDRPFLAWLLRELCRFGVRECCC